MRLGLPRGRTPRVSGRSQKSSIKRAYTVWDIYEWRVTSLFIVTAAATCESVITSFTVITIVMEPREPSSWQRRQETAHADVSLSLAER